MILLDKALLPDTKVQRCTTQINVTMVSAVDFCRVNSLEVVYAFGVHLRTHGVRDYDVCFSYQDETFSLNNERVRMA